MRLGTLSVDDVPNEYIHRDGNVIMLNTRSSVALSRTEIPRSAWTAVDVTGDVGAERRLSEQLRRNGLDTMGIRDIGQP